MIDLMLIFVYGENKELWCLVCLFIFTHSVQLGILTQLDDLGVLLKIE